MLYWENKKEMISKHKLSFEGISDKIWKNLDKKLQIDVSKYRRVRRDVIKFKKEIEKQKELIKEKQLKVKKYNKILTHLYSKINHLKSDYLPIINVVSYSKNDNKDFIYWNINVKFQNKIKSNYLGSDIKVRKEFKDRIGLRKNISNSKLKKQIEFYLVEEVMDMVIDNKDNFDNFKLDKDVLFGYIK